MEILLVCPMINISTCNSSYFETNVYTEEKYDLNLSYSPLFLMKVLIHNG